MSIPEDLHWTDLAWYTLLIPGYFLMTKCYFPFPFFQSIPRHSPFPSPTPSQLNTQTLLQSPQNCAAKYSSSTGDGQDPARTSTHLLIGCSWNMIIEESSPSNHEQATHCANMYPFFIYAQSLSTLHQDFLLIFSVTPLVAVEKRRSACAPRRSAPLKKNSHS